MSVTKRALLLVCLASGGCDAVFGSAYVTAVDAASDAPDMDLDDDGEADSTDPCLAPLAELARDPDGDEVLTLNDGCPFDAVVLDTDEDGLDDRCDPDVDVGGNRRRCAMDFTDPALNERMWRPRNAGGWALGVDALQVRPTNDDDEHGLLAIHDLLGTATLTGLVTVDATLEISEGIRAGEAELWLSAGGSAASDVGCLLFQDDTTKRTQLRITGDGDSETVDVGIPFEAFTYQLRGSFTRGAARAAVRCEVTWGEGNPWIEVLQPDTAMPVDGRPGFRAKRWAVDVLSLDLLER